MVRGLKDEANTPTLEPLVRDRSRNSITGSLLFPTRAMTSLSRSCSIRLPSNHRARPGHNRICHRLIQMKQTAHPDERRGIHSSQRVICHYAQPARQAFELANWIRLEDIEQAKQSERGDHRNDSGRESHGHECYELAADFIDDDLLRVFESADPTGPAGGPDPNAEDHNVNQDQEYERLFV